MRFRISVFVAVTETEFKENVVSKQLPFYTKFPSRDCAVCGECNKTFLYRQRFAKMADSTLLEGYDVVSCTSCGFTYADRLPSQVEFDLYYQNMSKYEFHETGGKEPEYDTARFRHLLEMIEPCLPGKNSSIIDIGCATGRLLSLLVEKGYIKVIGLDPSPGCARAAEKIFGINVVTGSVAKITEFEEKFDCMILAGILEHICDLGWVLTLLRDRLSDDGIICIQVPDASQFFKWSDAPFQQFSIEHINFFSPVSLRNLMEHAGFSEVRSANGVHPQSATTMMPVVTSVFRKREFAAAPLTHDEITERGLREYIRQSSEVEDSLQNIINCLVVSNTPLLVWGAGTHTLRLLETTSLAQADIRAFVDVNRAYHGKHLNGVPILPTESLREMEGTILVSSRVFQNEINCQIRDQLRLTNPVILLYDLDHAQMPENSSR